MNFKPWIVLVGAALPLAMGLIVAAAQEAAPASASTSTPGQPHSGPDRPPKPTKPAVALAPIVVTAPAPSPAVAVPAAKATYDLPQSSHGTDAALIREQVNLVDPEDAVKYFPSLFLRKRNEGDTQAVLATRTAGLNSSARSLVYADDILLSALIGNDNTKAAPRWGLVSPESIDRIDFLYGPYAAAYPGNAMGGVMLIATKMPDHLVADGTQTESFQTFSQYGTRDTYRTDETGVVLGNRNGPVSWLVTDTFENSHTQPLALVTNGAALLPGTYPAANKTGAPANVVGAGGLLHSQMNNVTGKASWDITPELNATYQIGFWSNDATSDVQTYLRDAAGDPTFAGLSGFASQEYTLEEQHLANSLSLQSKTGGFFDWDFSASTYYYLDDVQRNPGGVTAIGTGFTSPGKLASLSGTNWTNADFKGLLRPGGPDGAHAISFGLHGDRYELDNPTYAIDDWTSGPDTAGTLSTAGRGATWTEAFWAQDAWRFAPHYKLTFGGRLENWQAVGGANFSGGAWLRQPDLDDLRFSPKISFDWTPSNAWELTASFGQAYRFPTVTELYQIVSSGGDLFNPNPNLKPEEVFSEEVALLRKFDDGTLRLSFFNENVNDALISQTSFLPDGTTSSYVTNVDAIRNTGVELDVQKDNALIRGLSLFGSVTYVDSVIESDPSFASATGTTAKGKRVPYVPDWRATFGATYHPDEHWALTAALRYSGTQNSTLDNSDTTRGVFGAFDSFLVVDLHVQYQLSHHLSIDAGIDNVNGEHYFLYHPFPQRTYVASIRAQF